MCQELSVRITTHLISQQSYETLLIFSDVSREVFKSLTHVAGIWPALALLLALALSRALFLSWVHKGPMPMHASRSTPFRSASRVIPAIAGLAPSFSIQGFSAFHVTCVWAINHIRKFALREQPKSVKGDPSPVCSSVALPSGGQGELGPPHWLEQTILRHSMAFYSILQQFFGQREMLMWFKKLRV